jgi:tetratricopeptide (TPR) repeat protein
MNIRKNLSLIIIIISFLSCKERIEKPIKKAKYIELEDVNIQNKKFGNALKENLKMIGKNPEIYFYYSQRGLLFELVGNKKEAELYYSKGRKMFEQKEEYYWSKYDSTSMAIMLLQVGDSIKGRKILRKIINNKKNEPERNELEKLMNQTHGETIKLAMIEITKSEFTNKTQNENGKLEGIEIVD